MTDVTEQIKEKLFEIEHKEGVRILYACESGSRAWAFASPDSDYDVRFVYIRPVDFYLKLENTKDTLECELNEIYDISGWDVKKFLCLLNKSNPSVFEWAASPVVYKTTEEWNQILKIINNYFSIQRSLHHYNSITKNNLKRYFDGKTDVRYKPYLYNLRQCLACEWIMDRKSPPPIEFDVLKNAYLPEALQKPVDDLLKAKKMMKEKETGLRFPLIDSYVEKIVLKVEKYLEESMEKKTSDWREFDCLFLQLLNENLKK